MIADKKRIGFAILLGLLFLVLILLLWDIFHVIMPFFLGLLLAYLLEPCVRFLTERKIPVVWAILLVYFVLAILLVFVILFFLPKTLAQISDLGAVLPQYFERWQLWWQNFWQRFQQLSLPESFYHALTGMENSLQKRLLDWISTVPQRIGDWAGNITSFVLSPLVAFYLLRDKDLLIQRLVALFPPKIGKSILELGGEVNVVLRQFLQGYLLVSLIVAIAVTVGLSLCGMPYSLTLGIIAGIADLIPYFGPFIGAVPAVLLALMMGKRMVVLVIIVYLLVQQIENVVSPKIIGDSVGLHPLAIIFILLLGGYWFDVVGMILAIPFASALKVIVHFSYARWVGCKDRKDSLLQRQIENDIM